MYARGQTHGGESQNPQRNSSRNGYRIPPGYHGSAFSPEKREDGTKVHTPSPHIYKQKPTAQAQRREDMTVYSPRGAIEDVPYRETAEKEETVSENSRYTRDEEETYETCAAVEEEEGADMEDMAEDALYTLSGAVQTVAETEDRRNRALGEMIRALFGNLRREDWLLVALLILLLLDGSASPDILILLAVLLAYRL